jgi:hypothetical protein
VSGRCVQHPIIFIKRDEADSDIPRRASATTTRSICEFPRGYTSREAEESYRTHLSHAKRRLLL